MTGGAALNTGQGVEMEERRRSIFRSEAVRRYMQAHEESILPRLVCPRFFAYLWTLLLLLLGAGVVTWLAAGRALLQK